MKVSGSGVPQFSLGVKRGSYGLQLQIDTDALMNLNKNLQGVREGLKQAYIHAVNETNQQVASETAKLLTQEINAERTDIEQRIVVSKVKEGDFTTASITIKAKPPLSMRMFRPDQRKEGVYVRPMRRSSGFIVRGAFGPDIRRLGKGVYKRRGKSRLPIRKLKGIALTRLVRRAKVLPRIDIYARTQFKRNLNKSIVLYAFGNRFAA